MKSEFGRGLARARTSFGALKPLAGTASLALAAALSASPAGAIVIKPVFDSSITSRSNAATIESAFNAAAKQFDAAFANPATVNIRVSWGSVAGHALPSGDVASSLDNLSGPYSYSALVSDLTAASKSRTSDTTLASAVSHLPKTDPTRKNQFEIPYAEAKAIGLLPSTLAMTDGYIGFNASSVFDFNPVGGITAGAYDFEGLAAHEIEEVLGRITGLQSTSAAWGTPFDLYRYASVGVSSFSYTASAYFSINGGATNLGGFNISGGGDRSDWRAVTGVSDLQDAYFSTGKAFGLTTNDLVALDALGWGVSKVTTMPLLSMPGTLSPISGAAVPEPAAWSMLIAGFGLIGGLLRRRRALNGATGAFRGAGE
jgi:hypothetical protein